MKKRAFVETMYERLDAFSKHWDAESKTRPEIYRS